MGWRTRPWGGGPDHGVADKTMGWRTRPWDGGPDHGMARLEAEAGRDGGRRQDDAQQAHERPHRRHRQPRLRPVARDEGCGTRGAAESLAVCLVSIQTLDVGCPDCGPPPPPPPTPPPTPPPPNMIDESMVTSSCAAFRISAGLLSLSEGTRFPHPYLCPYRCFCPFVSLLCSPPSLSLENTHGPPPSLYRQHA